MVNGGGEGRLHVERFKRFIIKKICTIVGKLIVSFMTRRNNALVSRECSGTELHERARGIDFGQRHATVRKQDTVGELSLNLPIPDNSAGATTVYYRWRRVQWDFYKNAAMVSMASTMP